MHTSINTARPLFLLLLDISGKQKGMLQAVIQSSLLMNMSKESLSHLTVWFSLLLFQHIFIKQAQPLSILKEVIHESNAIREREQDKLDESDDEENSVSRKSCKPNIDPPAYWRLGNSL